MMKIFKKSLDIFKDNKQILVIVTVLTILSLGIGLYFSQSDTIFVKEIKDSFMSEIESSQAISDIAMALKQKNILYAVSYTAAYNSIFGAFLTTTLIGVLFPLPILVMMERGILIGLLYGSINGNIYYYILLIGTIILEFGAYVLSASLGVNIGLSFFWPKKFGAKSRWEAFKISCRQALEAYPLIILILVISAIWEIGGLFLLTQL